MVGGVDQALSVTIPEEAVMENFLLLFREVHKCRNDRRKIGLMIKKTISVVLNLVCFIEIPVWFEKLYIDPIY